MPEKLKNPKLGEIWLVNLPMNNGYCLNGRHPCFVVRKFGNTVQVIPISENKNNIHFAEIPIDRGKCNLIKNSKLKMCQYTSVTIENFIHIIGKADRQTIEKIENFILHNIVNFIKRAA
ncbi:MAG: type II toxin-antitoxin system PemK/MazF family toxin [Lacibacter sp.]